MMETTHLVYPSQPALPEEKGSFHILLFVYSAPTHAKTELLLKISSLAGDRQNDIQIVS